MAFGRILTLKYSIRIHLDCFFFSDTDFVDIRMLN